MICWFKNFWQLIAHPYAFFEARIAKGNFYPALIAFISALLFNDLGWIVFNGGAYNFSILDILWPLFTYPIAVMLIYAVCHLIVKENRCRSFFAVWGFSYLPTLLFFFSNILIHTLNHSPWWKGFLGQPVVGLIFWTFTLLMLLWKVLFLATTLRLAGNLNLLQIVIAFVILIILIAGYWMLTLTLGLGKIPFI